MTIQDFKGKIIRGISVERRKENIPYRLKIFLFDGPNILIDADFDYVKCDKCNRKKKHPMIRVSAATDLGCTYLI